MGVKSFWEVTLLPPGASTPMTSAPSMVKISSLSTTLHICRCKILSIEDMKTILKNKTLDCILGSLTHENHVTNTTVDNLIEEISQLSTAIMC